MRSNMEKLKLRHWLVIILALGIAWACKNQIAPPCHAFSQGVDKADTELYLNCSK